MNILVSLDSRTLPVTNNNVLVLDFPSIYYLLHFSKNKIESSIQLLGFVQCFSAGYCVYCIFAMKKMVDFCYEKNEPSVQVVGFVFGPCFKTACASEPLDCASFSTFLDAAVPAACI